MITLVILKEPTYKDYLQILPSRMMNQQISAFETGELEVLTLK